MNEQSPNPAGDNEHDLEWLAFCYIHDELDSAGREAFETRLRTDLDACEAVSRAVELSALVQQSAFNSLVLGESVAAESASNVDRSHWRLLLAMAAGLLVVVTLALGRPFSDRSPLNNLVSSGWESVTGEDSSGEKAMTAAVWSELQRHAVNSSGAVATDSASSSSAVSSSAVAASDQQSADKSSASDAADSRDDRTASNDGATDSMSVDADLADNTAKRLAESESDDEPTSDQSAGQDSDHPGLDSDLVDENTAPPSWIVAALMPGDDEHPSEHP